MTVLPCRIADTISKWETAFPYLSDIMDETRLLLSIPMIRGTDKTFLPFPSRKKTSASSLFPPTAAVFLPSPYHVCSRYAETVPGQFSLWYMETG